MTPNILLVGGHGKISQILTPLLLSRSWNVTSMIRATEQKPSIEKLGEGQPGRLSVLVSSVEDVKSESDAHEILEQVKPDWVVWSAGAGGRGGASRTMAVDHDAAIAFTKASVHTPSIKKFLTVSYIASRRNRPSWWNDDDWAAAQKVNTEILPTYYVAKVGADEVLTILAKQRIDQEAKMGVPEGERFHWISLRPGGLTAETGGGVRLGHGPSRGNSSREAVAQTIATLLAKEGARGWIDMLDGEEEVEAAVEGLIKEGVDSLDGEDLQAMNVRVEKL